MSDFDWVEARSNCTVNAVVFEQLSKDVQGDLERHNVLNPGMAQCQWFDACADGRFYVERLRVPASFSRTSESAFELSGGHTREIPPAHAAHR